MNRNETAIKLIKLLLLPVILIVYLIPKNRNIWIFGSQYGHFFNDNSMYFFKYVNEQHNRKIKAVWLTLNTDLVKDLKDSDYNCYYFYSLRGLFYSIFAGYSFVSYAKLIDIPFFVAGTTCFQLWHGTPIRKIRFDDNKYIVDNAIKSYKKYIYQSYYENHDYLIVSSDNVANYISTALHSNSSNYNVLVLGSPRFDALSRPTHKNLLKVVTYLPTFRKNKQFQFMPFDDYNIQSLIDLLTANNAILQIKLHKDCIGSINIPNNCDVIKILDNNYDTQQLLSVSDILITDYSSCFVDFLLLDRPIIFIPYDFDDYFKITGLYLDYEENILGGKICHSFTNVIDQLTVYLGNSDSDEHIRHQALSFFHKYTDNSNCKRLMDYITGGTA